LANYFDSPLKRKPFPLQERNSFMDHCNFLSDKDPAFDDNDASYLLSAVKESPAPFKPRNQSLQITFNKQKHMEPSDTALPISPLSPILSSAQSSWQLYIEKASFQPVLDFNDYQSVLFN
jgi:hypothetical protein